ncbi:MAG TPA: LysM peptidoglycan-binding domain-containing protein, partial [Chitinophagaceae bacterium]|nr:LysM peptidoglycan-binding domain-containing protein [Chitinophagaceae bacterium]
MVKCLIFFLGCFLLVNFSFGQKATLIAEGTTPDLYLLHQVKPKQNFYSIGRLYNISAKEISAYNHLQFENGLAIGQTIKIPLTAENFSQAENDQSSESLIPVYHIVQSKEGLYRISIKYNKVPMTTIKKWNNLASDNVSVGAHLIIGYLKVNPAESSLGRDTPDNDTTASQNTAPNEEPQQVAKDPATTQPAKTAVENEQKQSEPSDNNTAAVAPTGESQETSTRIKTTGNFGFSGGYF